MARDRITLTVPARGEYAKTVRLAAAELASRLGMSYDEVDDVRIAAEEAFVYACDCVGDDEDVTFRFEVSEDALGVTVGPMPDIRGIRPGVSEGYAEFILRSVCDEFEISRTEEGCMLTLSRRAAVPAGEPGA